MPLTPRQGKPDKSVHGRVAVIAGMAVLVLVLLAKMIHAGATVDALFGGKK